MKNDLKHFDSVKIVDHEENVNTILEDNSFDDITFDHFHGHFFGKIKSNAFTKTSNQIKSFDCLYCRLKNEPPKYDLKNVFNQMSQLNAMSIGLDNKELPTDFIKPSKLTSLFIRSIQSLTVKSGAFQNLNQLDFITFIDTSIDGIKKQAFQFNGKTKQNFEICFDSCNLTGK